MTKEEFYDKFANYALDAEHSYGVPFLSALAQSALETGWGKSCPGNMMFGIKADSSWTGKTQLLWTSEYKNGAMVRVLSKFRAYDSPGDSFMDYGRFLRDNKRYKAAFNHTDPYKFSKEVATAGYATDPNYYKKIESIIDSLKKKAVAQPFAHLA